MPLTIILAHKLNAKIAELRRNGILPWLRPDSKTQVCAHEYRQTHVKTHLFLIKAREIMCSYNNPISVTMKHSLIAIPGLYLSI